MGLADRASDLAYKKRRRRPARVRTPEGVAKYGQSIGTIIRRDLIERARALFSPKPKAPSVSEARAASAPAKPRRPRKPSVDFSQGWLDDWTERDAGLYYDDPRPSYVRMHGEGVYAKITPAAAGKWRWTVESQVKDVDNRPASAGLSKTLEEAMRASEQKTAEILAGRKTQLFADKDVESLSHVSGRTFKRVGRTAIEQDYGDFQIGIEFDPRSFGGGYYAYLKSGDDKRRISSSSIGHDRLYKADKDLEAIRTLYSRNPFALSNMRRREEHDSWHNYNYGIRGVDWYEDGDWEPNTTELRRQLAEKDSKELGIDIAPEMPIEYQELLNNVVWSYETMYPGFSRLFKRFVWSDYERYGEAKKKIPLAWNRNLGGSYANKDVWSEIGVVPHHWEDRKNLNAERAVTNGSDHFHTSRSEAHPEGYQDWEYYFLDVIHHEIGHTVHAALYSGINMKNHERVLKELESMGILENRRGKPEWAEEVTGTINPVLVKLLVSEYAGTNLNELLAEIWTEYVSDPHPRESVARIGEILEEALTAYLNHRAYRKRVFGED